MRISELIEILADYRSSNGDREIIFYNEDNMDPMEYSCISSSDELDDETPVVINFINNYE